MVQESSSSAARPPLGGLFAAALEEVRARRYLVSLVAVFVVAVLVRTYVYSSVFRGDDVYLLANDPYHYRFAVEGHVASGEEGNLRSLLRYTERDPMLVVGLSLAVALVGVESAGAVLAWYPVVAGTLTVLLVGVLGRLVSGSRLVGVVAAVTLALSPVHVSRTALGFADHHAADFLWITASAVVLLALVVASSGEWGSDRQTDRRQNDRWQTGPFSRVLPYLALFRWPVLAALLAWLLAALVLSWIAGPLFLVPAAVVVIVWAAAADRPGWVASVWAAAAFLGGAVLVGMAHSLADWHLAGVVAVTMLLATIVAGVVGGVSVLRLLGMPRWSVCVAAVGFVAVSIDRSLKVEAVQTVLGLARDYVSSLEGTTIAETVSIVGGPFGVVTGPLSLFGVGGFVAGVTLLSVSVAALRRRHPGLLLLACYAWYFLAGALVQRRFAGELSPFAAVLVALALVSLARRAGVVTDPSFTTRIGVGSLPGIDLGRSERVASVREAVGRALPAVFAVLLVLLVVSSSGFLAVRMNQSIVTDTEHAAAVTIRADAESRGLVYPESYVLASVGDTRRYNYVVGGDDVSEVSMEYAASHYAQFLHATSPTGQYLRHEGRVGYVVTTDTAVPRNAGPESMYVRLHDRLGSAGDGVDGAGHYRLVYADPEGAIRAFALVPGAIVTGAAAPGTVVTLSTPVAVGDTAFTFSREVVADDAGRYAARVPYAGSYTDGGRTVTVTDADVREGRLVGAPVDDPTAIVFAFEAVHNGVVLDSVGGTAGIVRGAIPTDGGLRFVGDGSVTVDGVPSPRDGGGFAVGVAFEDVSPVTESSSERRRFNTLVGGSSSRDFAELRGFDVGLNDGRVSGALGDGTERLVLGGPAVDDGERHEALLWWNGSVAYLVVDGEVVDSGRYEGTAPTPGRFAIGSTLSGNNGLYGVVTEVRYVLVDADAGVPPVDVVDIAHVDGDGVGGGDWAEVSARADVAQPSPASRASADRQPDVATRYRTVGVIPRAALGSE